MELNLKLSKKIEKLKSIYSFLKLDKRKIMNQILIIALSGVLSIVEVIEIDLLKRMVNATIMLKENELVLLFFKALAIVILIGVMGVILNYLIIKIDNIMVLQIQQAMIEKLLKVDIISLNKINSIDIFNRIDKGVVEAQKGIIGGYRQFVINTLMICVNLKYLLSINYKMSMLLLFLIILLFLVSSFNCKIQYNLNYKKQIKKSEIDSKIKDFIFGFDVIKVYMLEKKITNEIENENKELKRIRNKINFFNINIESIGNGILMAQNFLVIIIGITFIKSKQLDIGSLIAILILLERISKPILSIANIIVEFKRSMVSVYRGIEIFNLKEESHTFINAYENNREAVEENKNSLEIKNINYEYEQNNTILDDISFSCLQGEINLIYGESGGGKTTLINMLLGFYSPMKGGIYWNKESIYSMPLEVWREKVSYVPQNINLFSGTILNNLKYGGKYANIDEIQNISKRLNMEEVINKKEKGYNTEISYNDVNFSGGELQRLNIIRSLLKKSDIIILDEPSSYLDNENEYNLMKILREMACDKIIIIVSHRKSLLDKVDNIFELKNKNIYIRKGKIENNYGA